MPITRSQTITIAKAEADDYGNVVIALRTSRGGEISHALTPEEVGALVDELRASVETAEQYRAEQLAAALAGETVHGMHPASEVTSCCGRTPFDVPSPDRVTFGAHRVTCAGADGAEK